MATSPTLTHSTRLFDDVCSKLEQDGWINVLPQAKKVIQHTSFSYKFLIPNKSFLHHMATFRKKNSHSDRSSFQLLLIFNEWANGSPLYIHGGATYTFVDELGGYIAWDCIRGQCATKQAYIEYVAPMFIDTLYQIAPEKIVFDKNKTQVSIDFIVKDIATNRITLRIKCIYSGNTRDKTVLKRTPKSKTVDHDHDINTKVGAQEKENQYLEQQQVIIMRAEKNSNVKNDVNINHDTNIVNVGKGNGKRKEDEKTEETEEMMCRAIDLFNDYMLKYRENGKKYSIWSDILSVYAAHPTFVFRLCLRDVRLDKIENKNDEMKMQRVLKSIDYKDPSMNVISRFGVIADKIDSKMHGMFILDEYGLGSSFAAHGGLTFSIMDSFGVVAALMAGFRKGVVTKRAMIKYIRPVKIYTLYHMVATYDIKTMVVDKRNVNELVVSVNVFDDKNNMAIIGEFVYVKKANPGYKNKILQSKL